MIPLRQTLARRLPRAAVGTGRVVLARFQSGVAENAPPTAKEDAIDEALKVVPKMAKNGPNGRRALPKLNPKLRDISAQVRGSVDSANGDLLEALEIMEEGLSYLREVQVAEGIPEDTLFSLFNKIGYTLMNKAVLPEAVLGHNRAVSDVLDLLAKYKVAHQAHFSRYMAYQLSQMTTGNAPQVYQEVLQTWVKYVEYSKTLEHSLYTKPFGFLHESGFRTTDIRNLVFFAYVMSCLNMGVEYSFRDAARLLQSDRTPEAFHIQQTVRALKLDALEPELEVFKKNIDALTLQLLDPNGSVVRGRVNNAIRRREGASLGRLFAQVQEALVANKVAITEATLVKFMEGFYETGQHRSVFSVFQQMLANGIARPGAAAWDYALRAMGHTSYIKQLLGAEKTELAEKMDRMVKTMQAHQQPVTAKTLAILVGAYANLGRFEKVDEAIEHFEAPLTHAAKSNILVGYLVNHKVEEAEARFKEYTSDGLGFVPSSTAMNTFLSHYAKEQNFAAVDGILQFMKAHNVAEDVATYAIAIDVFFKMCLQKGLEPNIEEVLAGLAAEDSFILNAVTLTTIVDGLVKGSNIQAARALFDYANGRRGSQFNQTQPQLLTTMIKGELDHGLLGKAEALFEKMVESRNDPRMWNMMIKTLLERHEALAMDYFGRFQAQKALSTRVAPNHFTYYFLLLHFVKRGDTQRVQLLLGELEQSGLTQLGSELPDMLRRLLKDYRLGERLTKAVSQ